MDENVGQFGSTFVKKILNASTQKRLRVLANKYPNFYEKTCKIREIEGWDERRLVTHELKPQFKPHW